MKALRLTELHVAHFRGATNRAVIKFDNSKSLVVVFGENGTGKSTIVDALDLIANGKVGSLVERSSAKIGHAPAIGKKQADVSIKLVRSGDTWNGSLKSSKPQVQSATSLPTIDILRRSQLLRLVEAEPSKRYEALQHFIAVRGVEDSENQLDRAVKTSNQEMSTANTRRIGAEDALSKLWESNGKPESTWQEWAQVRIGLNTSNLDERIAASSSLVSACDSYIACKAEYQASSSDFAKSDQVLADTVKERTTVLTEGTDQTPNVIDTLTAVDGLIKAGWNKDSCPVCEQHISPTSLSQKVTEALNSMKSLKSLNDREAVARRTVESKKQGLQTRKLGLLDAIRVLLKTLQPSQYPSILELKPEFESLIQRATPNDPSESDLSVLITECDRLVALRELLSTSIEEHRRDKHQLHSIQTSYQTYVESINEGQAAEALHLKLSEVHKRVRTLRIKFVQDILDEVSTEADRLYQIIHPDENTKAVRFTLDEAKRGSLNQYGEFAGHHDIEPQGYYSDSHLDTLGFCLWLALAKRTNPKEKIIVLDDVFTSVDVAHLGRIIDLIDAECDHFAQVFIFTHNRNWFDRYRFNQAVAGKAHKLELRRWTPTVGLRTDWTSLEIDDITDLAGRFKNDGGSSLRQELASRCGILLESLLGFLSKQYRTSVPNTPDGLYTLGDLLGSCTKLFKVLEVRRHAEPIESTNEASCVCSGVEEAQNALKALAVPIRNGIGCHFNQVAAQLSDTELDDFAEATLKLFRSLVCSHPDCGQIPQKNEPGYHRCNCKRTRLILTKQL